MKNPLDKFKKTIKHFYKYEIFWYENNQNSLGIKKWDISEAVINIKHTTTLYSQPACLKFTIKKPPTTYEMKFDWEEFEFVFNQIYENVDKELGSMVQFKINNQNIFQGYVFTTEVKENGDMDVVCYDQMRYLQNKVAFIVGTDGTNGTKKTQTLSDVFNQVCTELQVDKFRIEGEARNCNVNLDYKVFIDKSYFDVLQWCLDEMNIYYAKNTPNIVSVNSEENIVMSGGTLPVRFFIRDEFGTLVLTDIEYYTQNKKIQNANFDGRWTGSEVYTKYGASGKENQFIYLGDDSLMTSAKFTSSIDKDVYNEIQLYSIEEEEKEMVTTDGNGEEVKQKGKQKIGRTRVEAYSDSLQKKWGTLRYMKEVDPNLKKDQLVELTNLLATVYFQPKRTVSMDSLGIVGVDAGIVIVLDVNAFNYGSDNIFRRFLWVESAEHDYGDIHTMRLNFTNPTKIGKVERLQ